MTDAERQELYTLMQQWGRNDDILYQKVREWVEAKIGTLQLERDALRKMIAIGSQARCMVCNWPLKKSASEGCVPGNCSYRPGEHSPEYEGWLKRAKLIYELCSTPASGELARKPLEAQNG